MERMGPKNGGPKDARYSRTLLYKKNQDDEQENQWAHLLEHIHLSLAEDNLSVHT